MKTSGNKKEQSILQDNTALEIPHNLMNNGDISMSNYNVTKANNNNKRRKYAAKKKRQKYDTHRMPECYIGTVSEWAKRIDVHTATILVWIRRGQLKVIDNKKPQLIHGTDMKACLLAINNKRKKTTNPGEFFCFSCKASRPSQIESLCTERNEQNIPVIRGKCQECGCSLYYISSEALIQEKFEEMKKRSHGVLQSSYCTTPAGSGLFRDSDIVPLYNASNERLKHRYLDYAREVKGVSDKSLATIAANLLRCERLLGFPDFGDFDDEMAKKLKSCLREQNLSIYTATATLSHMQQYMYWLHDQKGYRRKILLTNIAYLNVSQREKNILGTKKLVRYPDTDMLVETIISMPTKTPKQLRDQAMMALLGLTGVRDGVISSLCLKHIDVNRRLLLLDDPILPVKGGHGHVTAFIPLASSLITILQKYVDMLRRDYRFIAADPLFPKLKTHKKNGCFSEGDYSKEPMKDAQIIARVCKQAFMETVGESFSPHKIRHTLMAHCKSLAASPMEIKALSQNLGHKTTMHTMETYGQIDPVQQIEVVQTIMGRANAA